MKNYSVWYENADYLGTVRADSLESALKILSKTVKVVKGIRVSDLMGDVVKGDTWTGYGYDGVGIIESNTNESVTEVFEKYMTWFEANM